VGATPPVKADVFALIASERSIGGSPTGSPITSQFCNRHKISPLVEEFPLSRVNEAMDHLKAGKARYRIVLRNDSYWHTLSGRSLSGNDE
jgi:uncharacterized zinc-type alcohol dehydrogenase-like protein